MFGQQVAMSSEAYCEPRSEWWMQPFGGCLTRMAAFSAAQINSKKIRRLMREHDLQPKRRRRFMASTDSDHD